METSLDTLSLSQLLDLSIGAPEKGAVQFAAMRKLLQVMLEHLDVQYLTTEEPWPGQLSGPSLAELATEMEQMKKEIKHNKEHMSKVLLEEFDEIKAELSCMSENIRKIQKAQSSMTKDMKKIQKAHNEDTNLMQELREEIDRIQTAQTRMEGDVKKSKEALGLMKKMGEDIKKLREDTTKWREESREEIIQQMEAVLQETKRELQLELEEQQQKMRNAILEQLMSGTAGIGDMAESTRSLQEEQEEGSADCSKCSFNIKVLLGKLFRCCEKLQEQVDSLESRQMAVGRVAKLETMMRNWGQDQEHLHCLEATIVQIQGDCEKLSLVSGSLQEETQQNQKAMQMLFQSLEKLQKEKADEQEMLAAMDTKADKAALGSKVNCSQFDANMERLNERMQELQSQISGQEEHWNKMQQQFSDAMEEKLDRLELKAFRKRLEESWNRNIEDLEKRMMGDTGAGIKKQLPVPFSCLSCDRMLTMHVPGQNPETLPYLQPLPPSKEPLYSQRAHGSPPRVRHCCGDHHSSSSRTQHIKASPQISAQPPRLLNRPRVNQLLDSSGHTWRGHTDQLPAVIRTQHESGPATSREHRPGTEPRHISWARGLLQPLPPRQTSTAPIQVDMTHRPVLDLAHLVRSEKKV
ncbi:glutamine-rich protein 2-like [Cyanistes caeruleus]|uniref:Glutamine-rich protein 2-like n=1 Tax=Cyanistes caeruleus TaxID=156563 RepID=A0A8C0U0M9_CYACU|nr:glutamine-rich protein 2-like [Cyanistes caeruleus]